MHKVYAFITLGWFAMFPLLFYFQATDIQWIVFAISTIGLYAGCIMQIPEWLVFKGRAVATKWQICETCGVEMKGEPKDYKRKDFEHVMCKDCNDKYVMHIGGTGVFNIPQEFIDEWMTKRRENNGAE